MDEKAVLNAPAAVATDVKIASENAGIATGQTSIALPKAGERVARLQSWAVTDPNQLNPAFFSFKDISCVLKSEGKPKVLLDMVSGYCKVRLSGLILLESVLTWDSPLSSSPFTCSPRT
jgi:hypothetical protein